MLASQLGVARPLIQAPMAGAQGSALAIAVSNAGGLGSLPGAMLTPDGLRDEIAAITMSTSNPYNVNFFCHTPPTADADRETRWRDLLAPYYRELGIDLPAVTVWTGTRTLRSRHCRRAGAVQAAGRQLSFRAAAEAAARPGQTVAADDHLVGHDRRRGALARSARRRRDHRAGVEAGGHRGIFLSDDLTTQVGTFALVPQMLGSGVPVIAAGGIGDAAGVAAASRWVQRPFRSAPRTCCVPKPPRPGHRTALASHGATHTALTKSSPAVRRAASSIAHRRTRPDEFGGACVSARGSRRHAAAVESRDSRERRLLTVVVGSDRHRL